MLHRCDQGHIAFGQLKRKGMLFQDLLITPTLRTIKLRNQRRFIFNPDLIDTIFIAVKRQHPRSKADWVGLFKKTFRFTGGEITGEFLMSTGWLPGAHAADCPVHGRTIDAGAAWAQGLQQRP